MINNSSVTVTNGSNQNPMRIKLQTANGDPVGVPDILVASGGNTVVVITSDQRLVVTREPN